MEDEVTDVVCEECGRHMVIKYGPHGRFLACPGFPECRNTKPYLEKIGVACPKCGKDIVLRKTKKGRKYYGCENNPDCDFMSWQKPSAERCPQCGGIYGRKGKQTGLRQTKNAGMLPIKQNSCKNFYFSENALKFRKLYAMIRSVIYDC